MGPPLGTQVDQIGDEVRWLSRVADELTSAAVDLSELWDHEAVHEAVRAARRVQDAATDVVSALVRLTEVAR